MAISIGVCVTCYQYGAYIPEAIDSIIAQRRMPDHVVMVDDASGDGSADVLLAQILRLQKRGIPATVIEFETNRGSAAARNAAIERLKTDWILSLDGDDLLHGPEVIEQIFDLAYQGGRRIFDVVIGAYEAFGTGANGRPARGVRRYHRHKKSKYTGAHPYVSAFLEGHRIGCANSAFLRRLWEISPYDETLQNSEDTAFWIRAAQNGARFTVSKSPLSKVRFHETRKSFAPEKWKKPKRIAAIREIVATPPPVEFMASERHFIDHLAPVWLSLPPRYRGRFLTSSGLREYAEGEGLRVSTWGGGKKNVVPLLALGGGPVVSCASGDQAQVAKAGRSSIFFEHGAGQTYREKHSSYAGYNGREGVILFVVPGDRPEEVNRVAYPRTPILSVGCPKLDRFFDSFRPVMNKPPVVAISFHWDCRVNPETRSAFGEFSSALPDLKKMEDKGEIKLLGHGHPRIWKKVKKRYDELEIEAAEDFEEVIRRAALYVCDNSSTIFEFAATDRPVVLMNPSFYRRNVKHGLRFWDEAGIGLNCDHPGDLAQTIREALNDTEEQKRKRRASTSRVYRFTDGRSSYRAALAIMDAADGSYMNPLHTAAKLRILPKYPSPNQIDRGRKMAKQVEQPKDVLLISKTEFRNKTEEGHVRANRAFLTTRSRAKALVPMNARYPEATDNDRNLITALEKSEGRRLRGEAEATENGSKKPKESNPKREKPTGPSTTKPAGPSTTKAAEKREALAEAKDPAAAEVAAIMAHAETADDEELAEALGLESKETTSYRGYTIGEADSGGWREIRDGEGVLVKSFQGPERCVEFIDDLLDNGEEVE